MANETKASPEVRHIVAFELEGKDCAALAHPPAAGVCTGISLSTTHGDHVHARTIEWGHFDLKSKLIVSPRGHSYTSALPMGKRGRSWIGAYGFVGISVSEDRFIGEGMNEAGLNAGLFYFKGYGSLAPYDPNDTAENLIDMDLVRWTLSQFATVEAVKAAFGQIKVVPVFIDAYGNPSPTAHWRVTDKSGGSIVIEIVDEGKVYLCSDLLPGAAYPVSVSCCGRRPGEIDSRTPRSMDGRADMRCGWLRFLSDHTGHHCRKHGFADKKEESIMASVFHYPS